MESARNNDYTDVVMIHEHRGEPDGLVVCHMPYGPSAYFGIFNTVCSKSLLSVGSQDEYIGLSQQAMQHEYTLITL